jgi:hypothetical protein
MKKITRKARKFVRFISNPASYQTEKGIMIEEMRKKGYAYVDGSFGKKDTEYAGHNREKIDIFTKMWGRFVYVGKKRVNEVPLVCKEKR